MWEIGGSIEERRKSECRDDSATEGWKTPYRIACSRAGVSGGRREGDLRDLPGHHRAQAGRRETSAEWSVSGRRPALKSYRKLGALGFDRRVVLEPRELSNLWLGSCRTQPNVGNSSPPSSP